MLLAVCLWAFIWVAPYVFLGRRSVITAIELLSCALFIALFWLDRRNNDWKVLLCVFFAVFAIPHFFQRDIVSMAQGLVCLWVGYWGLRFTRDSDVQMVKVDRVKATELAGVVEYDSQHVPGACVEECSGDWLQQFSQVRTDDDGRFALPPRDAPFHHVRVSWREAKTAHLLVEINPKARPLLVRLKRLRASAFQ
jgi:hypothetical protein